MYCPNCGEENADTGKFCFNCGYPLKAVGNPAPAKPSVQGGYPSAPPAGTSYPNYAPRPPKDRSVALILEILPGLFGFLGFGWIYSGNVGTGVFWLIGMLFWDAIMAVIAVFSVGFSLLCTVPISIGLIALSAYMLNGYTKEHSELFGM